MDRQQIEDAILAWRDGKTLAGVHPLEDPACERGDWLWVPGSVRDLARVIEAAAGGGDPPEPRRRWRWLRFRLAVRRAEKARVTAGYSLTPEARDRIRVRVRAGF